MKASKLLEELVYNSQKAFISEDIQLQQVVRNILPSDKSKDDFVTYNEIVQIIGMKDENLRISFIKTIIETLINHDLLENDIDIHDLNITNGILNSAVTKAISDCK